MRNHTQFLSVIKYKARNDIWEMTYAYIDKDEGTGQKFSKEYREFFSPIKKEEVDKAWEAIAKKVITKF